MSAWWRRGGDAPEDPADAPPPREDLPAPLRTERLVDYMVAAGYGYTVDDEGFVEGVWDGNAFAIMLLGPTRSVLQVRGRWAADLTLDQRTAVLRAANDLNRERLFPKVYGRVEHVGGTEILGVYAEVSVNYVDGATDAQIRQTIECGLVSAVHSFAAVHSALSRPEWTDGLA